MLRLLLSLLVLLWAPAVAAQERTAHVRTDDGKELVGTLLALDLDGVQIRMGGTVMTIPSTRIRSCRIEPAASTDPVAQGPAPLVEGRTGDHPPAHKPPADRPTSVGPTGARRAGVDPTAPEHLPHDLRHLSLWRQRLQAVDEAYPWLVPTVPTQWISLGLLAAILLSLVVHLSAKVMGSDRASLGRGIGLALWYLASAVFQVAMVPVTDFAVVVMLLGNTSVALFLMSALFGLSRGAALVALTVQLGCCVLGYGVLELITALLASTGTTA